ncbi:MAG: amidohydrolase family protein [Phycisphaerales bacterium]|nr:amidohydrolase family protein [Phycisphaerales bacterium]
MTRRWTSFWAGSVSGISRRMGSSRGAGVCLIALALLADAADAQFFGLGGAMVIKDARVVTGDGRVIEKASISISGERIGDVGPDVKGGLLAKSWEASGKTVAPGFIDPYSRLGVLLPGAGRGDPTSKVFDAWDPYARDVFDDAFRNGVTLVYVGPRGGAGVLGTGAIVALSKGEGERIGSVVKEEAALHINMGSGQPAIARINTFNAVRRQFRDAVEYRNSIEDYKSELEEYEKKIKERAEKKAKEEAEKKGKPEGDKKEPPKPDAEKKSTDKPAPPKDGTPPKPKEDAPKPKGDPPKPKEDPPKPKEDPPKPPKSADSDAAAEAGTGPAANSEGDASPPSGENPLLSLFADPPKPEGGDKPASGEKKDEKKEEEIKKPGEPKPDRDKDVLLKAIDRKLPVRIEAHRSEDILNALDLVKEFNLDAVLEGATEAHLVADAIGEAKIPVVLGAASRGELRGDDEFRRFAAANAAALDKAKVRWAVGSGAGSVAGGRFVLQNAQLTCAAAGLSQSALELVTRRAADFLGLESAGRIGKGQRADLVVWSGDPSDPASKVERVYVAGKVVYDAAAK